MRSLRLVPVLFLAILACAAPVRSSAPSPALDGSAGRYVKLVLDVGQVDDGYVDAYYGPEEWKTAAAARKVPLDQLGAVATRVAMLRGQRFTFDEESQALYDAVSPRMSETEHRATIDSLSAAVPGTAPLSERTEAFRRSFIIPPARLDAYSDVNDPGFNTRGQLFQLMSSNTPFLSALFR